MKKQICLALAICLAISLSGCFRTKKDPTQPSDNTTGTQQSPTDPTTEQEFQETMVAVSVPTTTENTTATDGTVLFQYTYQHMSLVLHKPAVADKIILDFLNRVDSTRKSAEDTANMAKNAYNGSANWVPYLYHLTYSPVRIDHKVLSLFGNNVVFSGAGHPERTCISASYDLLTGDVLTLASIMTKNASTDDFRKLVLDGLSEMAEGDYLYEDYANTVKNRFNVDASGDEAWYFTQTGLCFYFSPYEIAPYSSGVISVEIPYEKLQGLLHEAYFPSERNVATGTVTVSPFESVSLSDFSHIAEIVAVKDGNMYMAHTDGAVQDVRILLTDKASNYTVFAAYNLSKGDGIMIQADTALLENMRLTYKTGGESVTIPLTK